MAVLVFERYKHPLFWPLWVEEDTKYQRWLLVEAMVAEVREERGEIPAGLAAALRQINFTGDEVRELEKTTNHDLQAFLGVITDHLVKAGFGHLAPYLHLGLTSYDVEDTAAATMLVETADILLDELRQLAATILGRAEEYKDALNIARTHGVHAEVSTFCHKMLIWYKDIRRMIGKTEYVRTVVAVGKLSGAVGTYTLNPEIEAEVCRRLGLVPEEISNQIIGRTIHSEFVHTLVQILQNLANIATEVRNLHRTEINEVQEYFAKGQIGSSAMKHKRNPIRCENVTGAAKLVRGLPQAFDDDIITWHERDLTNSIVERLGLPFAINLTGFSIQRLNAIVANMLVDPDRMRTNLNLTRGVVYSQNLLLALRERGMDPKAAQDLVQSLSFEALENGVPFMEVLLRSEAVLELLNDEEVRGLFNPWTTNLRHMDTIYARFFKPEEVTT